MDPILKPEIAFGAFLIRNEYLNRFNISAFADNLQKGDYTANSRGYFLRMADYHNQHFYDKLPRSVKFRISEASFTLMKFSLDAWYDYDHDKNEIYKDYCEQFFKRTLKSKKVQNFYNKLKKEHPEIFI